MEKFYVGPTYEFPIPWSWLSRREKFWRLVGRLGLRRAGRPLPVIAQIDQENKTITVDAASSNDTARGTYMRRLLRLWPGVAANS